MQPMSLRGGEAYFALRNAWAVVHGLRSFPRRSLKGSYPPFRDIPVRVPSVRF